jgi:hypothetical protein
MSKPLSEAVGPRHPPKCLKCWFTSQFERFLKSALCWPWVPYVDFRYDVLWFVPLLFRS